MWFQERALVFVDARTAAIAVYRETPSGLQALRFGAERIGGGASPAGVSGYAHAGDAIRRLRQSLRAPASGATFLLPLGATFPYVFEAELSDRASAASVDQTDLARFRLAPNLPFPISQAEVRVERLRSAGPGVLLAQGAPKAAVAAAREAMLGWGFTAPSISSLLSCALSGLPATEGADIVLGDRACVVAVRDSAGSLRGVHLRLLGQEDDPSARAVEEARRAAGSEAAVRWLAGDVVGASLREHPMLALFAAGAGAASLPDFGAPAQGEALSPPLRALRMAGYAVLAYALVRGAIEGRESWVQGEALNRSRAEGERLAQEVEDTRRALLKNPDVVAASASVRSSPARVRADIAQLQPEGVSVGALKIEYTGEGARVEMEVFARSSPAYDAFLDRLAHTPSFSDVRPGAEIRPGFVRATVSALHQAERAR